MTYYISILLWLFRFIVSIFEVYSSVLKPLYRFWNGVSQELLILQQDCLHIGLQQCAGTYGNSCTVIDRPTTCCCWFCRASPAGGSIVKPTSSLTVKIQFTVVYNYLTQPSRWYCNVLDVSYLRRPLYIIIFSLLHVGFCWSLFYTYSLFTLSRENILLFHLRW